MFHVREKKFCHCDSPEILFTQMDVLKMQEVLWTTSESTLKAFVVTIIYAEIVPRVTNSCSVTMNLL